ncbi:class I SAM-dependent methyltransferase [Aureibaculum marinum]|uniref:Class I SAM-dependent methyltransferase n=1 Tax=Aureibaculum marinum TaxID=2487930 RepID=A0A3N4NPR4_9FLAO|nr:class I SAM-dependent methyltransferase [Aureibaculum marinum]RPD96497.1 class I SAM-dependent methyltransferase [Aureibaculum marinum]
MKQIDRSPIKNNNLEPYISCKDYTVSNKIFSISIDKDSGLLITNPQPKEDDLGKYYESEDYISHSDTKKSLVDKLYHWVRNFTIKKKVRLINSFNSDYRSILDIGAGTGDFLAACKNDGWSVTGIEPSEKAKEIAYSKLADSKIKIYNDIQDLELKSYDVITMWHVLEHVPNLCEYVSKLKELLSTNGTLIIAVPNYKSYDANVYQEFWAAYDVPRHLWHFSRKSISQLFEQENLKVEKVLPMMFDSFYVSLLSEKYKRGKSNMLKAFWIGLISNIKAKTTKEYSSLIYIIKNV